MQDNSFLLFFLVELPSAAESPHSIKVAGSTPQNQGFFLCMFCYVLFVCQASVCQMFSFQIKCQQYTGVMLHKCNGQQCENSSHISHPSALFSWKNDFFLQATSLNANNLNLMELLVTWLHQSGLHSSCLSAVVVRVNQLQLIIHLEASHCRCVRRHCG